MGTMRFAVTLAALLLAAAPPALAGRSVAPERARELLEAARRACDVRSAGSAPLRLRALVRALRLSNGEHAGRYELAWAAPERWRLEIRFAGYHRVEVRNEQGRWEAAAVPWMPVRVGQLIEGLDVAALLRLEPGERVAEAESRRRAGGRRLHLTLAGGRDGERVVVLEEADGLPVAVLGPRLSFRFADWQEVGGAAFPRELEISDAGGVVATATVRRLVRESALAPALFVPPHEARPAGANLEPDDPDWESYRERLARFFRRSWQLPTEARLGLEGVSRLGFAVRRDGEISNLRVLESSGHAALDRAALAAVAAAAPLPAPPLPPEEKALEIAWTVTYNTEEDLPARPRRHEGAKPVSGRTAPGWEAVDEVVLAFLEEQDAPGATLAVVHDDELVLSRGYGWADAATREPLEPDALLRIASLSKPLTAMTVLSLVEEGRLELSDSPWRLLGLDELAFAADPRHERLTVEHLLQHRGGLDASRRESLELVAAESGRSLDGSPAPSADELVERLAGRALDFEPGSRFAYSNSGYAILGRLVEAVTGRDYEDVVREHVLLPLGLTGARIGSAAERAPGEARAHLRDPALVPAPDGSGRLVPLAEGGFSLETLDAHGGWLASAPELARLAAALDHPKRSGLLGRRSVRRLWERPPGRAGHDALGRLYADWYGCGWRVGVAGPRGELEQWHEGRLPGSSALLVRQADGLRWALLFNQGRGADGRMLAAALEPRLREAFDAVLGRAE